MSGNNEFRSPEPGLSDAERRQLAELERGLAADDPALADALVWGVLRQDRPDRATKAFVAAVGLVILLFALVVGGPGAAAFTAVAVLGAARVSTMMREQPGP